MTNKKSTRDNQKSRLYAAERMAFGYEWDVKPDFKTLPQVDAYIHSVTKGKIFQRHYPEWSQVNLYLRPGRRARMAFASMHEVDGEYRHSITLPLWARRKWVILHEMAHIINDLRNPGPKAAHGYQFALIFLDLVEKGMGKDARRELRKCYRAKGVSTVEERTCNHSPEYRQMLSERMKRINAERNAKRQA